MAIRDVVQVRRCHICGTVAEAICSGSTDRVLMCKFEHCAKKFAPFYFTPDRFVPGFDPISLAQKRSKQSSLESLGNKIRIKINPPEIDYSDAGSELKEPPASRIRPLIGFTVWWPSDQSSDQEFELHAQYDSASKNPC